MGLTTEEIHRIVESRVRLHEVNHHAELPPVNHTEQKIELQSATRNGREWSAAIDRIHDLLALAVYRHYVTHPQMCDLLDLVKHLRALVNHYEADEQ